jgi:hypothetical protein
MMEVIWNPIVTYSLECLIILVSSYYIYHKYVRKKNKCELNKIISCCNENEWNEDKNEFLSRCNSIYGYSLSSKGYIDEWYCTEMIQNPYTSNPICYMDYAGASLPLKSQLTAIFNEMIGNNDNSDDIHSTSSSSSCSSSGGIANPHSAGPIALHMRNELDSAEHQVLSYFCGGPNNAKNYRLVWTSGATHGMQLVGSLFPFTTESMYLYSKDNHTSMIGIRQQCLKAGGTVGSFLIKKHEKPYNTNNMIFKTRARSCSSYNNYHHLITYPLESNFDGKIYSYSNVMNSIYDINVIKEHINNNNNNNSNFWIYCDIAKAVTTKRVNLVTLGMRCSVIHY